MDKDSKSLEALYESIKLIKEDEAGRPFPYYGSNAAATSTAIMGTEPLTQAEIEVPEKAGQESAPDAEDEEDNSSLRKLLDTIKITISDYENSKQMRFNRELEESVINEINLQDVRNAYQGAKNVANVVKTGVNAFKSTATSKNPLGNLAGATGDVVDAFLKKEIKQPKIIGDEDKKTKEIIIPINGKPVVAVINKTVNPNIKGTIINVLDKNEKYVVRLNNTGTFGFAQLKTEEEKPNKVSALVTSTTGDVHILNKTLLNGENDKNYTDTRDTALFDINNPTSIKWAYPIEKSPKLQTGKPQKGDKIKTQKGSVYTFNGAKWVDQNKKPAINQGTFLNTWRKMHGLSTLQQVKKKTEPIDNDKVTLKNGRVYTFKNKQWVDENNKPAVNPIAINNAWKQENNIPIDTTPTPTATPKLKTGASKRMATAKPTTGKPKIQRKKIKA